MKATTLKLTVKRLKPYLRWVLLGGTIFFLAKALKDNWQEVLAIELGKSGWGYMAIALLVTLLAHIWSGWVWSWILRFFDQPVDRMWCVRVYLKTNIAKYLPGNIWHFYGRVWTAKAAGVPRSTARVPKRGAAKHKRTFQPEARPRWQAAKENTGPSGS